MEKSLDAITDITEVHERALTISGVNNKRKKLGLLNVLQGHTFSGKGKL